MIGPLCAGFAMQFLGADIGFVLVGIVNAVSFGFELALLTQVHAANPLLGAPKVAPKAPENKCTALVGGFPVFVRAPSGMPLLVLSYALLYYTVLSPHGVVLTAYLQTRDLPPPVLSGFRAAGACSGVLGQLTFQFVRKMGTRAPPFAR